MKGRPLAKAGYEQELISIRGFIAMQNKAESGTAVPVTADKVCIDSSAVGGLYIEFWPVLMMKCRMNFDLKT